MRKLFVLFTLVATLALTVCGCNQKQTNTQQQQTLAATTKASGLLNEMSTASTGAQAEQLRQQIADTLKSVGGDISAIGISQGDLDKRVQDAYHYEAMHDLDLLKHTSTDFAHAEDLRKAFLNAQQKSGRPMAAYHTSELLVDRYVARCYLAVARKQGGNLKPSDFHAAGLPVPKELVIKYRQRPVHKKHLRKKSVAFNR